MKADKLIKIYKSGNKNFYKEDLRGQSFRKENLSGINLTGCDIRGTDFTETNLKGANLTEVKAGLQQGWLVLQQVVALFICILLGIVSSLSGYLIALYCSFENIQQLNGKFNPAPGIAAITTILIVSTVIIFEGLTSSGLTKAAFLEFVVIVLSIASFPFAKIYAINAVGAALGVILVALIGSIPFTILNARIRAVAICLTVSSAIAGIQIIKVVVENGGRRIDGDIAFIVAFVVPFVILLLSVYIAWQVWNQDLKFDLIQKIQVWLWAIGGTSFRHANLTDAKFTGAILESADFRKANLTRTCFNNTIQLDRVRPGTTYLQNAQVRQVLIFGEGQDKNFDRQDLQGVNFQRANLMDASFIGADLSGANLQDANLSRAKLVQTQLNGTDFTGATLSGAYIQDWGITTDTKFNGVRCEYVYMRLQTKENPNTLRKPDNLNEVFADGEFGDFIQPIFDTLDLYHSQGVDPRAIAVAFKELAQNNPKADLEIVAIERRGEDKILLRAKTATTANKSELSKEYFIKYNELKALVYEEYFKPIIEGKDFQIRKLETMITTVLERPDFYIQNYNNQGKTIIMTGDRNINTGGGNYNERIQGNYVQGNYYAAGQPQTLAEAAAEIQLLLEQLEQTYPTTTSKKMVAEEAINRIKSNPTLKKRVINAVKEGGLAAFEKAIDNPAGAFIVEAIKGWQEVQAED